MGLVDIHPSVVVAESARIEVTERLVVGPGSVIGEDCEIKGRDIEIGAYFWMDKGARIGGGSCFGRQSILRAGHFLHMGWDSFINTARPVTIGNEVGLGTRTAIYTHGAYLSIIDGFPVSFAQVTIGDRVWIPGATVNPGVTIGNEVVVGVGSVVTSDIPSGSLAAGVPAKVIRSDTYPKQRWLDGLTHVWDDLGRSYPEELEYIVVGETRFDLVLERIDGLATEETEEVRDHLRRYGIRFYSWPEDGEYKDLEEHRG